MLKLGIIGISEGNGHPYSWAAIFNGYNPDAYCLYPEIVEYLSKHKGECIQGAMVRGVWTQDFDETLKIAEFAKINGVYATTYMYGMKELDAILLARDDDTHYDLARPFLEAGLPIYIDKPLAYAVKEAKTIYGLEQYPGQIFTCSALRYAREFQIDPAIIKDVDLIEGIVPKDWKKYAVHVIEPALLMRGNLKIPMVFHANREGPIRIILRRGNKDDITLTFEDSFSCFKSALQEFVDIVNRKENPIKRDFVMEVVRIIENGEGKPV